MKKCKINPNSFIILIRPKFGDLFSLDDTLKKNPLMEGFFRNYSTEKIEYYIKKRYGNNIELLRYKTENNDTFFKICFYNLDENKTYMDEDMALCGYLPVNVEIMNNSNKMCVTYGLSKTNKVNEYIKNLKKIYAIKEKNEIENILKYGINGRFILSIPNEDIVKSLTKRLFKHNKNTSYVLLEINTEDIISDFNFEIDIVDMVFTSDNIEPQKIKIVKEYKINANNIK